MSPPIGLNCGFRSDAYHVRRSRYIPPEQVCEMTHNETPRPGVQFVSSGRCFGPLCSGAVA